MAADFLNLSNWNNSSTNQLPQSLLCCTWIQSKFMNLQALLWSLNISGMWIVIGDSWLFRVTFNVIALLRNNNLKGYINSKPGQSPTEISIIFLLHRWRNEGSERFRDLLKIPQQLGNHAEVQAKSLWLHILTAPHHPVLILCIPGICPTILQIFTQGLPCVRHCVGITVYLVIQDRKFHISLTPPLAPPCTSVWILSSRDFYLDVFLNFIPSSLYPTLLAYSSLSWDNTMLYSGHPNPHVFPPLFPIHVPFLLSVTNTANLHVPPLHDKSQRLPFPVR